MHGGRCCPLLMEHVIKNKRRKVVTQRWCFARISNELIIAVHSGSATSATIVDEATARCEDDKCVHSILICQMFLSHASRVIKMANINPSTVVVTCQQRDKNG